MLKMCAVKAKHKITKHLIGRMKRNKKKNPLKHKREQNKCMRFKIDGMERWFNNYIKKKSKRVVWKAIVDDTHSIYCRHTCVCVCVCGTMRRNCCLPFGKEHRFETNFWNKYLFCLHSWNWWWNQRFFIFSFISISKGLLHFVFSYRPYNDQHCL